MDRNVKLLGIVSFINDMSSEIIFPLLPFFLISLNTPPVAIGFAAGIIEGVSGIMKVISGYLSDLVGRRKPLVFAGYFISQISKLGIALSTSFSNVIAFMLLERSGKGVRTAPRDALIAESSKKMGKAFGFHRAMDSLGAVLGSLIALILLLHNFKLRSVITFAALLGFLSLLPLVMLKEVTSPIKKPELGVKFHRFALSSIIFGFANLSYMFFLIKASNFGIVESLAFYALYSFIYSSLSYPAGVLSDKIGKSLVAAIGYILMALSCVTTFFNPLIAIVLLGLFMGLTDAVQRGIAAELSKTYGFGLGTFQLIFGVSALIANTVYGIIWSFNPSLVFEFVIFISITSSILHLTT